MDNSLRQGSFLFQPNVMYSRQDFMVAPCNAEALKAIESWPSWSFFALSIYGPKGCGKTHLAHIFADYVMRRLNKPIKVKIMKAGDVKTNIVARLHEQNPCLVLEDVNLKVNEEALFHLFNLYHNEGGYLLFTSHWPLARINFSLPDLKSRLKMIPSIAILEPDDSLLEALIVKLFSDRQIMVPVDVVRYIIHNMERSFSYAIRLVERTDELSLCYKSAVTLSIVKQAMHDISHNTQPDLF